MNSKWLLGLVALAWIGVCLMGRQQSGALEPRVPSLAFNPHTQVEETLDWAAIMNGYPYGLCEWREKCFDGTNIVPVLSTTDGISHWEWKEPGAYSTESLPRTTSVVLLGPFSHSWRLPAWRVVLIFGVAGVLGVAAVWSVGSLCRRVWRLMTTRKAGSLLACAIAPFLFVLFLGLITSRLVWEKPVESAFLYLKACFSGGRTVCTQDWILGGGGVQKGQPPGALINFQRHYGIVEWRNQDNEAEPFVQTEIYLGSHTFATRRNVYGVVATLLVPPLLLGLVLFRWFIRPAWRRYFFAPAAAENPAPLPTGSSSFAKASAVAKAMADEAADRPPPSTAE